MTAKRLDGRALAESLRQVQRQHADTLQAHLGRPVALGMVLVGEHGPSAVYVRNKARAAAAVHMTSRVVQLPNDVTQHVFLARIAELNADPTLDAFLIQLPLPKHLDSACVVAAIDPRKDADGLHPLNVGALVAGQPGPRPCTPSGCLALLDSVAVPIAGAHAVVVGRSNIVGKPLALMLLARHATVTICHSRTEGIADHVGRGDIVIAAVGCPGLIRGAWLKPGAAVVDVGINRGPDGLVGDVVAAEAASRAAYLTPVPGGVGPMTVAMLLTNTLQAAAAFAPGPPLG